MERYVIQLLEDIAQAAAHATRPWVEKEEDTIFFITREEEEATAPVRLLHEWTGIYPEQLPPADMLNDDQLQRLLQALKSMLEAFNCHFVLQFEVPERLQYEVIRHNMHQQVKVMVHHMGFFEMCEPGKPGTCIMNEYCQCTFFKEFFAGMSDEDLPPEEERRRMLEIEIRHLQRRHGDDWRKYYPYYQDPDYDDEEEKNPFDNEEDFPF